MPGRDPEMAERSRAVAEQIRGQMRQNHMSGVELRAEIERLTGVPVPNAMWISRRLTGEVNLVEPVRVVYGPTEELKIIAQALGVNPDRLVRVVNQPGRKGKTNDQTETETDSAPAADDQDAATATAE